MSNNLVSRQLSSQSVHVQLDHNSNEFHSSVQMGFVDDPSLQQLSLPMFDSSSADALSQQLSLPNDQPEALGYMSNMNVSSNLLFPNMQMVQMTSQPYSLVSQEFLLPNRHSVVAGNILDETSFQPSLPAKRKEPMEPLNNSMSQKLPVLNKRVAQMDHRPWLQQMPTPNTGPVQIQSVSNAAVSQRPHPATKRPALVKSGSQQQPVQRSQSQRLQALPKVQGGSIEPVRSKLRESLSAALALVLQEQEKSSQSGKSAPGEDSSAKAQKQEASQSSKDGSGDVDCHVPEGMRCSLKVEDSSGQTFNSGQSISITDSVHATQETEPRGPEFNFNNIFHEMDMPFSENVFVKDELLQGNGLSWVLESEAMPEKFDTESTQEQQTVGSQARPQAVDTPENLASKIEVELFKLFGGVNKKYKEKGRSLIFNLKDRNNPELRERVVFGEIAPERLCSMNAEELASKELSEWRMAKAEELAQMVVLPDSDADMRRLVKKTHKGEVQVDFEEQHTIAAEVAVGSRSVSQTSEMPEKETSPNKTSSKKEDTVGSNGKNAVDHKNVLTISSSEGGDLMQGLMVDDTLKDPKLLPPIVSLDEFMESLNSEPPFEDLPVDAGQPASSSEKEGSHIGKEVKSPVDSPKADKPVSSSKTDSAEIAPSSSGAEGKQHGEKVDTKTLSDSPAAELVWEGSLQLTVSSVASITGVFKSGERTTTEEWPASFELKGRVKLEAFDKFLQGLPMSRSRAFMVVHFACKEGSAESERASLCEVSDSYVLDERVGYAEPAPGFEIYLCPPHSRTDDMLSKVLSPKQVDTLNGIDKGLIGVVVWRKPQSISPNYASHHKHNSSKKHHLASRSSSSSRHQYKDNANVNAFAFKHPHDGPVVNPKSEPVVDEDDADDVPPGFGPPGFKRDDDDLPEFNFSNGSAMPNPNFNHNLPGQRPHTARPVDQIRQLIQKYGQSDPNSSLRNLNDKMGSRVATRPWNDDDDDDMPEWNPEESRQRAVQTNPGMVRAPVLQHTTQQLVASQGIYQAMALPHHNLQGNWTVPPASPYTNGRQFQGTPGLGTSPQGMNWNRDVPKSRGF